MNQIEKAFQMAETEAKIRELLKQRRARKIKELVAMGIDRQMAATMVDSGVY